MGHWAQLGETGTSLSGGVLRVTQLVIGKAGQWGGAAYSAGSRKWFSILPRRLNGPFTGFTSPEHDHASFLVLP